MVEVILNVGLSTGSVKDSRIHPAEDLLLQEANDQLPDPTEYTAQVQVSVPVRTARAPFITLPAGCVGLIRPKSTFWVSGLNRSSWSF